MRQASVLALVLALTGACAEAQKPPSAPRLRSADPAVVSVPEPAVAAPAPRLGAPGGFGAGARQVPLEQPGAGDTTDRGPTRALAEPLVPLEDTRAVVLLYHAFDRGPVPLSVPSSRFEKQLVWLRENRVEIVTLGELLGFLEGKHRLPARVAVITIDDGLKSVYDKAWPILAREKARFTLGLPTYYMQTPEGAPMLSWAEVKEMLDSGLCELASHGHRHRALPNLSSRLVAEELELSKRIIIERTGHAPEAYFYPLGALDPIAMRQVVDAGYRAAFSAIGGPIALGSSPRMRIPRTSIFHDDGVGTLAHYFGERFMQRLPDNPRAPADPLIAARRE
jgi:peptidoglycan/xylan/chitin deacetylase (PgdA/CDA1 family)